MRKKLKNNSLKESLLNLKTEISVKGRRFLIGGNKVRRSNLNTKKIVKLHESDETPMLDTDDLFDDNYMFDNSIDSNSAFESIHELAVQTAEISAENGIMIDISDIEEWNFEDTIDSNDNEDDIFLEDPESADIPYSPTFKYFSISKDTNAEVEDVEGEDVSEEELSVQSIESYTFYMIADNLYVRPTSEFDEILADLEGSVPAEIKQGLTSEYDEETELPSIPISDLEACSTKVLDIMSDYSGQSYDLDISNDDIQEENEFDGELNEKIYIHKYKGPSTGFDSAKSIKADEAMNGTPTERTNDRNLKIAQDSSNNTDPTDLQSISAEKYKPKIPNFKVKVNKKSDEKKGVKESLEYENYELEPMDKALWTSHGNAIVNVQSKNADGTYTILFRGMTIDVTKNQLQPYSPLANGVIESPRQFTPKLQDQMDLTAEKFRTYKDMNDMKVPVSIVFDNIKMNTNECYARVRDIMTHRKDVHVLNEDEIVTVPQENIVIDTPADTEEWPWVVYSSQIDGEPERKVKADPKTFFESSDEDPVICITSDNNTINVLKKFLKMII